MKTTKVKKLRVVPHNDDYYKLQVEALIPIEDKDLEIDYTQRAIRANKWLVEQLATFRRWDQAYDYYLVSRMFKEKGNYFLREGHLVRSEKTARKMLELSIRFDKLSNEETVPKHLQWHTKTRKREEVKLTKNGMEYTYKIDNKMGITNEEYCRKMMRIAVDKEKAIEDNYLKDTMALLAKYWPTFWD